METQMFCAGDSRLARVLVIGHDPRLQESGTQAHYAFFGHYLRQPLSESELTKYNLAAAVYSYIGYLTRFRYTADQIILTNLCNRGLPHAPWGKIVLIPEECAIAGIHAIREILEGSNIQIIFAMSEQVNYWLQKLGFYTAVPEFLDAAEPTSDGINHVPPYYEPKRPRAFTLICGERFSSQNWRLYPILHVKSWPLKEAFIRAYRQAYVHCINDLMR